MPGLRHGRTAPGRRAAAVAVAVVAVVAFAAGGLERLQLTTSVTSILPARNRAVVAWQAQEKVFGGPPIAIELAEPTTNELLSGTPLLHMTRLEGQLAKVPNVAVVYGPGTVLNQLGIAAGNLLAELTGYRQGLIDRAEAAAKASGKNPTAAGQAAARRFDLRYGPAVVRGLPIGLPSLSNPSFGPHVLLASNGPARASFHWLVPSAHQVDIFVRPGSTLTEAQASQMVAAVRLLVRRAGLPRDVHGTVTGLPVLAVSLAQTVLHELPVLGALAVLGVLASFFLTRRQLRWWRRLVPFGAGAGALVLTVAFLGWLGQGLSVGVLVFLPIMVGIGTDYPIYAASHLRTRWLVALAAAGAAGCASLALSPLPFVRELGIALAVGLLVSVATGLAVARLGSAGEVGATTVPAGGGHRDEAGASRAAVAAREAERPPKWRRTTVALAVMAAIGAAAGWASLGSLPIEGTLPQLAAGVPGLNQALAAQSALGVGGNLDVSIQAKDVLTPAMLRWYQEAEDAVIARDGDQLRPVVSPTSLLSWLGSHPTQTQITAAVDMIPSYLTGAAFSGGLHHADLVFGADVQNLGHDQRLVQSVRQVLPPLPAGAHLEITGLVTVVAQSYQLLGNGTLWTDLAGIGAFGIVLLALAWRRRQDVLRAVVAAFLAVGWGALLLWVGGVTLSPLAVAVGSITTAVGGEFTFVAAVWRRRQQSTPWPVVLRAAVTSAVGFSVLAVSDLGMVRQFGIVLAGSIVLSVVAAAVLLSPRGPWPLRLEACEPCVTPALVADGAEVPVGAPETPEPSTLSALRAACFDRQSAGSAPEHAGRGLKKVGADAGTTS